MPHTPGPWHRNIKPAWKYPVVFAGRNTHVAQVATTGLKDDCEVEANIDLIAAAPDLLAALIKAEEVMATLPATDRNYEVYDSMVAAINRATGCKE